MRYNICKKKIENSISSYNINRGKMNITGLSGWAKMIKDYTGWDFTGMWWLAALTGRSSYHVKGFLIRKCTCWGVWL